MLNAILWDFHQGRNYSRGMWDVRNPLNKKVAATTTQPAQKQDKTWKKQSQPNASCWKEDGRNRGKHERLGHVGATSRKEPCWMPFWDAPLNKKVAATTTQPAQKQDKTWKKQSQPNASCWKEDGRNRGKHERLGHFGGTSRKEPCWMPFCGISTREEIILGVCEMSGTLWINK